MKKFKEFIYSLLLVILLMIGIVLLIPAVVSITKLFIEIGGLSTHYSGIQDISSRALCIIAIIILSCLIVNNIKLSIDGIYYMVKIPFKNLFNKKQKDTDIDKYTDDTIEDILGQMYKDKEYSFEDMDSLFTLINKHVKNKKDIKEIESYIQNHINSKNDQKGDSVNGPN